MTIALTWGGVIAPWDSSQVLVPLIVGLVLLVLFMVWEARWAADPLVYNSAGVESHIMTDLVRNF